MGKKQWPERDKLVEEALVKELGKEKALVPELAPSMG